MHGIYDCRIEELDLNAHFELNSIHMYSLFDRALTQCFICSVKFSGLDWDRRLLAKRYTIIIKYLTSIIFL